ncbi:hypothetical protein DY000_02039487 [Brassica cretica]|uniref:Uncharacterized protein n=1 Tax=Brassica cretica TaxID=69181 RepID=A0ABQ7B556_BRACR|nr:hypothetical protein DY000_02039487 [Brassica cretica]
MTTFMAPSSSDFPRFPSSRQTLFLLEWMIALFKSTMLERMRTITGSGECVHRQKTGRGLASPQNLGQTNSRARLQLHILAHATISSTPTGTVHAHQSISKLNAPCSISTTPPSVSAKCPIEQMTPITYKATCPSRLRATIRATCSLGPVPIRLRAYLGSAPPPIHELQTA